MMRRLLPALLLLPALSGAALLAWHPGAAPRQIARHLEDRAAAGSVCCGTVLRWIAERLQRADRGMPSAAVDDPSWSPAPAQAPAMPAGMPRRIVTLDSPAALLEALRSALPGDELRLLPGRYRLRGQSLPVLRPGLADAPIVLRAATLGEVRLDFDMLEGFHVQAPHWRFENLEIHGSCASDSTCEHAFHVVGAGSDLVLNRLRVVDFNAHVKVNGAGGDFPDRGSILNSQFFNTRARQTGSPVTPIDLVAASHWRIEGNLIADFVKAGSDRISYGAYAKGAGSDNRMLRNLVLCEHRLRGLPGVRVGLSLGGGGTEHAACRDKLCATEQQAGTIAGNLIAQCSDAGIYLNKSARALVRHNTLLDTAGLEARFDTTDADVQGNLVDGGLRTRDGARLRLADNLADAVPAAAVLGWHPQRRLFKDAARLDLGWRDAAPAMPPAADDTQDLCSGPTTRRTIGAAEAPADCLRATAGPGASKPPR